MGYVIWKDLTTRLLQQGTVHGVLISSAPPASEGCFTRRRTRFDLPGTFQHIVQRGNYLLVCLFSAVDFAQTVSDKTLPPLKRRPGSDLTGV